MLLLGAAVCVALTVSFICSLTEAVLLSLTPAQVANLSARHPSAGALWQGLKANIERPISVILILNTTANTAGAAIAGAKAEDLFGGKGLAILSAVFTFVALQYCEILPKTLGVRYNTSLALVIGRPLAFVIWLLTPLIRLTRWINRPFEARRESPVSPVTLEDISALAGLARISNLIGSQQEKIIRGASRLSGTYARQMMIPIEQVTMLSTKQSLTDAILSAHLDPHTRFPICEADDCTRIIGYVNFKEMIYFMRTNPNEPNLLGIIRPVQYVAPDRSGAEMLRLFVEHHVHMAIVQDAAGHALGLVTLEDIVEELVGELTDEFDHAPRMFHALSGGTWMVGGGVTLPELVEKTGFSLPEAQGTLSSWLLRRMSHPPRPGDIHCEGGIEFQIRRVRRGTVFEVCISRAGQLHPGIPPAAKLS